MTLRCAPLDANKLATKARQAWEKFEQRVAALSLQHQPPSPLSSEPATLNFINGQNVAVCEDKPVLTDLQQALSLGDYTAAIFEHAELSQAALKLFCAGLIKREQISSLLEIQEAKVLGKLRFFPIFESEDSHRFSQEAGWYLLPFLQHRSKHLNNLNDEQLRFFKALMKEVPLSEQYFYVFPEPPDKDNELRNVLIRFDSVLLHESQSGNHVVGLTFSAKNARLIARCGIDNMVGHVANLGRKSVDALLVAAKQDIRYADIYFPGAPTYEAVHNYPAKQFSEYYNTNHDYDHANTGSLTPRHFRHALLRMADLVGAFCRKHGYRGCTARWDLIDQELTYFRYMRSFDENKQYNEAVFCDFLDHGTGTTARITNSVHLFIPNRLTPLYHAHETYSNLGVLIMLDMCANTEAWKKLGLNPEALTGDYLVLYQRVKRIYPWIKNDPDYLQIFKLQHTFNLKTEQECLGLCQLSSALPISATLKRNNKEAAIYFHFSRRLDKQRSLVFLQLLKDEYAETIESPLKALFTKTLSCLDDAERLYLLQKTRETQGYFSFFRNLFQQPQGARNLRHQILELIAGFSVVKDGAYKAVLMLAISRCQFWEEGHANYLPEPVDPCKLSERSTP